MPLHAINKTLATGLDKIIHEITYLPHGYKFWRNLGHRQQSILIRWRQHLYKELFPSHVKVVLTQAILNDDGTPKDDELFKWLKDVAYQGNERKLYQDWYKAEERLTT